MQMTRAKSLLGFAVVLVGLAAVGQARTVVPFDFAWRHILGDPDAPTTCPSIEKDKNYGDGGTHFTGVASASDCCLKCAQQPDCRAWDWVPSTQDCWAKSNATGVKHESDRMTGLMPPRPSVPSAAKPDYDDSHWQLIDTPHDMLITEQYSVLNSAHQAFQARGAGWYRKHFNVPASWKGSSVWLYFEGVFHISTFWINGVKVFEHAAGYTSFSFRIDQSIEWGKENVLAIDVDATSGTGWWYEGGGLMRHQFLVQANRTHIVPDTAWATVDVSKEDITSNTTATQGVFHISTDVVNDDTSSSADGVAVRASIQDKNGRVIVSQVSGKQSIDAASHATFSLSVAVKNVQLWSVASPYVYTVQIEVIDASGDVLDDDAVPAGARTIRFDANHGLYLNERAVKLRGFCDHSTFAGVGAAVPDRVNLFRVQALRSIGANAWRMAHNPPVPARLHFMDHLGMVAMDENRDYGGHQGQGGTTAETAADEVQDMGDLVRRDRSHPSVILWSFCNEVGCNNETAAKPFRNVTYAFDGTRPVTQNHLGTNVSSFYLDVQGFSHKHGDDFDNFHKANPDKPTLATECCSCYSQRGEDADLTPDSKDAANATRPGLFYNNLIQECTASQVLYSDSREFVSGTFVWSGFDYYGESQGWPQVVKCRGTVGDVAGFTKETAYWLRSWWLSNISTSDAGRPALPVEPTVFIVESWLPPVNGTKRQIHVYASTPKVELLLNDKPLGTQDMPYFGAVGFNVSYEPGKVTAHGLDHDGKELAEYSIFSTDQPAAIVLSLDAPSNITGTGDALVLDGQDTAMVRATIVDGNNLVVPNATNNVTFSVVSGNGVVIASHNGDPASQTPANASWHAAYHGLVRAFVRTTKDEARPAAIRQLINAIDVEGGRLTVHSTAESFQDDPTPIVIEATSNGLKSARLEIPVTRDMSKSAIRIVE